MTPMNLTQVLPPTPTTAQSAQDSAGTGKRKTGTQVGQVCVALRKKGKWDTGEMMGLKARPSPIFLVRFLLQAREQADEAVLILVQSA